MDLISGYAQLIQEIVDFTGMSRPMLHMHAGMAIYVIGQLMLGTRRGSGLAILLVLQAELLNELMNRLYYGTWRWDDTSADIVLTLFWPMTCWCVSMFRRTRWKRAVHDRKIGGQGEPHITGQNLSNHPGTRPFPR
jgi:hypothetical protein